MVSINHQKWVVYDIAIPTLLIDMFTLGLFILSVEMWVHSPQKIGSWSCCAGQVVFCILLLGKISRLGCGHPHQGKSSKWHVMTGTAPQPRINLCLRCVFPRLRREGLWILCLTVCFYLLSIASFVVSHSPSCSAVLCNAWTLRCSIAGLAGNDCAR